MLGVVPLVSPCEMADIAELLGLASEREGPSDAGLSRERCNRITGQCLVDRSFFRLHGRMDAWSQVFLRPAIGPIILRTVLVSCALRPRFCPVNDCAGIN